VSVAASHGPQENRKGSTRKVAPGNAIAGGGTVEMQAIRGVLTKLRIAVAIVRKIVRHRALSFVVRTLAILSMSFAGAFGFLAAINSPTAHYDPHQSRSALPGCSARPAAGSAC
jgi:hypothetical protein